MGDAVHPDVWAISAEQSFADVLTAGLLERFGKDELGLARCTLLVPNNRASRAITEAFVRHADRGLLLPRMVAIGDLELGEALGNVFSPIGSKLDIPPAIEPMRRLFILANIIQTESTDSPELPEALRLAQEMARILDQLMIDEKGARDLLELDVEPELADHWQQSLALFRRVTARWNEHLVRLGLIEAAERRNRLLRHAADQWRVLPPEYPIIAAGITSFAPAIARLLHTVSRMPNGHVVIPGLDLELDADIWEAIGPVGKARKAEDAERPAYSHPQYHLKQLLDAMAITRDDVRPWPEKTPPKVDRERAALVRNIFLPARLSDRWRGLPIEQRRMRGIQIIEAAHQEEEAQAIALAVRDALETPKRRIAIVTPDRGLAARIVAHLRRWDIEADDSAGEALAVTPAGSFLRACATCMSENFAPVALLAMLKHPLAAPGEGRNAWLDNVRKLDLILRGPRPAPGLHGIKTAIKTARGGPDNALIEWFDGVCALFATVETRIKSASLRDCLDALAKIAGNLSNNAVWSGVAGRSATALFSDLGDLPELQVAPDDTLAPPAFRIEPARLSAILNRLMRDIAVRPPFGKHPRIAIYGLLEARLQSADLVIAAGLNEGVWPGIPSPDPWLAPMVRRELELPSAEIRIGLAAQDLAGTMGARDLILSRAARDLSSPTIASRFLLRLKAVAGLENRKDRDRGTNWLALARRLDQRLPAIRIQQPAPRPHIEQRKVDVAVTDLDRLRADPFAFYARKILQLSTIDAVDAEPSAAWRGIAVHDILEKWKKLDSLAPDALADRAEAFLVAANVHPLIITLWRPRLMAALEWVNDQTQIFDVQGRKMFDAEAWGQIELYGVKIKGKADRIDRLVDGTLAIVDYKTGAPPSGSQVEAGYALQLGLLGLMAERGGFKDIAGTASQFEYWSLAKRAKEQDFGYIATPIKEGRKTSGVPREEMVARCEAFLVDALHNWILGDEPFTAKLHPEYAIYTDYDQLMRLDEWYGRQVLAS